MVHTVRTAYSDSLLSYEGDLWAIPCSSPSQGLGQGNGAAPCIWALVSTPILIAPRKKGYGAAFKCCISKDTIVQIAPSPDTPTDEIVRTMQAEIDLYAVLA
eukprot:4227139-Ditylum_brightwellii.AAC.1